MYSIYCFNQNTYKYLKLISKRIFSLSAEAPSLPLPGRARHHQVGLAERPANRLPALPPADPHPAAGPGGPIGRGDESGRVHQRGVQQQ